MDGGGAVARFSANGGAVSVNDEWGGDKGAGKTRRSGADQVLGFLSIKAASKSMGSGKTTVVFLSEPITVSVSR